MLKVKSRSDHDVARLHPPTNVPAKYELPTPYGFWDTTQTNYFPPPAHPDTMGENNTPTALKGCGVKTILDCDSKCCNIETSPKIFKYFIIKCI